MRLNLLSVSIYQHFTALQTATCLTCFLVLKITLFNTVRANSIRPLYVSRFESLRFRQHTYPESG